MTALLVWCEDHPSLRKQEKTARKYPYVKPRAI
jgi:hypothetical protein